MTTKQALDEADRRWCTRFWDTRWPIALEKDGMYYVGFTKTDFLYVYGKSSVSYKEAFFNYDTRNSSIL